MRVPFNDLYANYLSIKSEIDSAIESVIRESAFINGHFVSQFEEKFAKMIGAKYCVFCSSGTSALSIAFIVHNKPAIVTQANSFVATSEACETISDGAIQAFVDVDENGLMNIKDVQKWIWHGSRTTVLPVHLFGQVVDVDRIKKMSPDVSIIEDAAQCHFGKYTDGSYVGSKGNTTCFSFFPGKRIGSFGDSGALVTNDEKIYKHAKMYRDHGRKSKFESEIIGSNMRGDGLQAAILSVKLDHALRWNDRCREIAKTYNSLLDKINDIKVPEYNDSFIYHLYVIRELSKRRDELKKYLESAGVSCGIHYKVPIHKQKAFDWANEQELPMTEMLSEQILSIPIFPELSDEQIEYICSKIKEFYK